jgi:hypothetical protein
VRIISPALKLVTSSSSLTLRPAASSPSPAILLRSEFDMPPTKCKQVPRHIAADNAAHHTNTSSQSTIVGKISKRHLPNSLPPAACRRPKARRLSVHSMPATTLITSNSNYVPNTFLLGSGFSQSTPSQQQQTRPSRSTAGGLESLIIFNCLYQQGGRLLLLLCFKSHYVLREASALVDHCSQSLFFLHLLHA